jgi:CRP-like cAMP-binding protein
MSEGTNQLKDFIGRQVDLPEDQWVKLMPAIKHHSFTKNDMIIRTGDDAQHVFFVVSGVTRTYILDKEGNEFTKAFKGPNQLIAPYAELLMGTNCKSNIQALSKCELISIKFDIFQELTQVHPGWMFIAKSLAEENFLIKEKRENEFLQLSAEERYREFVKDHPDIYQKIPQYMVASYIGVTPVFLSRMLKSLEKK